MSMAQGMIDGSANNNNNNGERRRVEMMQGPLRKGPWTAEEDEMLREYVKTHGRGNWHAVEKVTRLRRCGKSCRLRWTNQLNPNIKKGPMSIEEEVRIVRLHHQFGNKWASIAKQLPGRTDNEIKNFWNIRQRKYLRDKLDVHDPRHIIHRQQSATYKPLSFFPPPPPSTTQMLQHSSDPTHESIYNIFPLPQNNTFHGLPNGSLILFNDTASLTRVNTHNANANLLPQLSTISDNYPLQYNPFNFSSDPNPVVGQYNAQTEESFNATWGIPSVQDERFMAPHGYVDPEPLINTESHRNTGLLDDIISGHVNTGSHDNSLIPYSCEEVLGSEVDDGNPDQSFIDFLEGVIIEPSPVQSTAGTDEMPRSPVYDDDWSYLIDNFGPVTPTADRFESS